MFQILTHSLTLSFIHFLPFFFPPFTNSVLPSFPSFLDPFPLKSWSFWYALLLVFVLVFNNIESRNILINWLENILLKISSKQATVAKQEDSNSQTCFLFCFVLFCFFDRDASGWKQSWCSHCLSPSAGVTDSPCWSSRQDEAFIQSWKCWCGRSQKVLFEQEKSC